MAFLGLLYASRLRHQPNTEQYRSGHNGHDWKSCVPQKGTEGSNPSCSARKEKQMRKHLLFSFLANEVCLRHEKLLTQ